MPFLNKGPPVRFLASLFYAAVFATFAASLACHLATFAGIDAAAHVRGVWALHLVCMLAFAVLLFTGGNRYRYGDPANSSMWQHAPAWMPVVCGLAIPYALLNMALWSGASQGKPVRRPDGTAFLENKRKFYLREVTEEDIRWLGVYGMRTFSGHWVLFSLWATTEVVSRLRTPRDPLSVTPEGVSFGR